LHLVLLPLEPEAQHFGSAIGTFVGVAEPSLKALVAKLVLALELASIGNLVQTNSAFILL
jgi:hypothetical protein